MPIQNKQEQNEQFYNLLKEILETQTEIVKKIASIEEKIKKGANPSSEDRSKAWSNM